jgi:hypothetical protein
VGAAILQFPVREANTFDEAWALRAGQMKKRGDGQDKTRKLWNKAAAKVGHARLLEALKRYLREEKEPTCGYPGLSVWLNGERWDHWLDHREITGDGSSSTCRQLFPKAAARALMVEACGESWVISYLDPCTLHPDGWITPATGYAKGKLVEKGRELKAAGLAGIRSKV